MDQNRVRNSLTEIEEGYKQVSHIVMFCIGGLGIYSHLVYNIFSKIISNKFYGSGAKVKGEFENVRIYNNIPLTLESILMDINPGKYKEKDIHNDTCNLRKKIKFIHENNIVYSWSYYGSYMFFFERDFGVWKCYNSNAFVIPKTIYKIANISQGAIDAMIVYEERKNNTSRVRDLSIRKKVETSFSKFLNNLIMKMEPSVAKKFPVYVESNDVDLYIEEVRMTAEKLDEYDGLFQAADFEDKLPLSVREGLSMKKKTSKDLMSELVPNDSDLCKNKATAKPKKSKKVHDKGTSIKSIKQINSKDSVDVGTFKEGGMIDPFKDARNFTCYYHNYLNAFSGGVSLEPIKIDVVDAGVVLDLLTDNGKKNDMFFLKAWIEDFCKELQKKGRTKNRKYTSIRAFSQTLPKFKESFFDPR
jgi:hypothetical protein